MLVRRPTTSTQGAFSSCLKNKRNQPSVPNKVFVDNPKVFLCEKNPNRQVKPCASKSLWQQRHAPCHVSAAAARWHRLHFLVLAQAATIPSGSRGWIVTMATHLYHEHLQTGHLSSMATEQDGNFIADCALSALPTTVIIANQARLLR